MWFKTLFVGLKGLSVLKWVSPLAGLTSWINPVWGALMSVVRIIMWGIKTFVKGVVSLMQNPIEIFAVVVLCLLFLALGLKWGVAYDAHLVRSAEYREAALKQELELRNAKDANRASAAHEARRAAERPPESLDPVAPAVIDARPASDAGPTQPSPVVRVRPAKKPKARRYRRKPRVRSVQEVWTNHFP